MHACELLTVQGMRYVRAVAMVLGVPGVDCVVVECGAWSLVPARQILGPPGELVWAL